MSHQDGLSQWSATVSTQMPQLSGPQAAVLASWSYGMVVAQSCGITTVATFLGMLRGQPAGTLRQRLREWCYDAPAKRGDQRRDLDVTTCFAPLLRWVLAWWAPGERRLALAVDASTLGQRFTVLTISVVYRGCAIPVAWRVVRATAKGASAVGGLAAGPGPRRSRRLDRGSAGRPQALRALALPLHAYNVLVQSTHERYSYSYAFVRPGSIYFKHRANA